MQLEALKQAAENLEKLISESGMTEEKLFAEYRALKRSEKEQHNKEITPPKERKSR